MLVRRTDSQRLSLPLRSAGRICPPLPLRSWLSKISQGPAGGPGGGGHSLWLVFSDDEQDTPAEYAARHSCLCLGRSPASAPEIAVAAACAEDISIPAGAQ